MILTSWNCRGLASKPKKLALREMVMNSKADILLLQETLGNGVEVESVLNALLPGWKFSAMDSAGHSGGLAVGYREGRIKIRNQWGMKQGRVPFWNDLMANSTVKNKFMVLGGDLNFSLGRAKAWGPSAREDSLTDFFQNLLIANKFIDVNLIKLKPTWRNRRVGEARVAKRLDRFLINEDLSSMIPIFWKWVEEGGPSDHFPIYLDLSKSPPKPPTPFKFNAWPQETSFIKLFKETWNHPDRRSTEDKGFLFMENIKRLKKTTITWAKDRKAKHNKEIIRIIEELQKLESIEEDGYASQESKDRIIYLEKLKNQILLAKEEEWRLKSRAIWLKAGDENMRFFHNYAKGRKSANTIWNLKNGE
eukprot:PITA_09499